MKALFNFILITALPGAAFAGGYALTERYFRWKLIPFPFEPSGIAVGLGSFFWTLALLTLIFGNSKKRGTNK